MANSTDTVQQYYTQGTLRDRVFGWLSDNGINSDDLTYERLYPIDQLHGRGIEATREHARYASIGKDQHVLDLGCGIGGASRFLAGECGCRVTGIDLTAEFIEVASVLTRRCGLADRVEHRQAGATDLPFEDEAFDHVWCHNVTMNIEDKAGLVSEVARVLKPGGRFSCAEVGLGPAGEPGFPLPWGTDPASSFLVAPEEMRRLVEGGGLRVIDQIDLTPVTTAFRKAQAERIARGERPVQANHIAMGDGFPERARNMAANAEAGRVVEHIIVAEKI